MPVQRLPDTVHTLYAELHDRAVAAEAESLAQRLPPPGSFVSKRVKGNTYWYLQRTVQEMQTTRVAAILLTIIALVSVAEVMSGWMRNITARMR